MTHPVLTRRRAERARRLDIARTWAHESGPALGARAIVVVGSVARGDFNKWSDLDVLVVADDLPGTLAARLALVARRPPGLEAILWTPSELADRRSRATDPAATEAYERGVVVYGELPGS